jgi:hypothetical protein
MFFGVTEWDGEPINAEPHKCDELRWAFIDDLPSEMVPEVRQAIQNIVAFKSYSDYNF